MTRPAQGQVRPRAGGSASAPRTAAATALTTAGLGAALAGVVLFAGSTDPGPPPVAVPPATSPSAPSLETAETRGAPPDAPLQRARVLLAADADGVQTAAAVAELLPAINEADQPAVARETLALLPDEHYDIAARLWLDPNASPALRAAIQADLLQRPDAVRLPLLVRTLRERRHPLRADSLGQLQRLVGLSLGFDARAWDAAVREYLARGPMETSAPSLLSTP